MVLGYLWYESDYERLRKHDKFFADKRKLVVLELMLLRIFYIATNWV